MYQSRYFVSLRFLPLFVIIIAFILLPYFYNLRLSSSIFKLDFYSIWIAGCFSWLFRIAFSPIAFNRMNVILSLGCCYVLWSYLWNSLFDDSGLFAFITIICLIGIVTYLEVTFTSKHYFATLILILVLYLIQVCIGYYQAVTNGFRSFLIEGMLGNSGFYGNYLSSLIPLLLSGFISKGGVRPPLRAMFFTIFLLAVILLALTLARAAYLGSLAGCLFVLVHHIRDRIRKWRLLLAIAIIFSFVLIGNWLYNLKPHSALGRQTIYKISLNIITDNLFTGVGANRFSAVYNTYQAEYFKKRHRPIEVQLLASDTFENFNSLLQIFVEYGIVGLCILIFILYQFIRYRIEINIWDQKKWMRVGGAGGIICTVVCSFFSNPFHVTPILLIFVYHVSNLTSLNLKTPAASYRKKALQISIVAIFSVLVSYLVISRSRGELVWYKASEAAKYNNYQTANALYKTAYPLLQKNGQFLFNYGAEASLACDDDIAIRLLEKAKKYNSFSSLYVYLGDAYSRKSEFDRAEKNYLHAIHTVPSLIYPKYQLIQLYKKWKKPEQAKIWTIRTLQFPIKVRNPVIDTLLSELRLGM